MTSPLGDLAPCTGGPPRLVALSELTAMAGKEALDAMSDSADSLLSAAKILREDGSLAVARAILRRLICFQPGNSSLLLEWGLTLSENGDFRNARDQFDRAANIAPEWLEAHEALGLHDWLTGRELAANSSFMTLLRLSPRSADLLSIHAEIGLGRFTQAKTAIERYLASHPDDRIALRLGWLVMRRASQDALADQMFCRAHALTPFYRPQKRDFLLLAHHTMAEARDGAISRIFLAQSRAYLSRHPADPIVLWASAVTLNHLDLPARAEKFARACVSLTPGFRMVRCVLANILIKRVKTYEATHQLRIIIALEPETAKWRLKLARIRELHGDGASAAALFSQLLDRQRDMCEKEDWEAYGRVLAHLNRAEEAIAVSRRTIELWPNRGLCYWRLAHLDQSLDPASLRARIDDPETDDKNRALLLFALGRILEQTADFQQAFAHYEAANRLQSQSAKPSRNDYRSVMQRIKNCLTPAFVDARRNWGLATTAPIFIVGLPRSGSTLIEQILASHPEIEATSELQDLPLVLEDACLERGTLTDLLIDLSESDAMALACAYLQRVAAKRKTARPRFTDKMLSNFMHIGLIHLMFPNARIIATWRHPMALGLSNYKHSFKDDMDFTRDLHEMACLYNEYDALMAHFEYVMPNRIYHAYYEKLIIDPEKEIRNILDYCDLPFSDSCLKFWQTERWINTYSLQQVRQPIFPDGLDHWRHYEPWLEPLRQKLGTSLATYPSPEPAAPGTYFAAQ